MDAKKILALTAVALALMCVIPFDDADANINIDDCGRSSSFDNMNGGSVWCKVVNDASDTKVIVKITEKNTGKEIGNSGTVDVPAATETNPTTEITVSMKNYKSVGDHQIVITVYDVDNNVLDTREMTLTVDDNILSNWTTFAVIIIVAIVIAVIVYLKIRDNHAKSETNKMTFEELEAQRKAQMAQKSEKKVKTSAPSTERRKYEKK